MAHAGRHHRGIAGLEQVRQRRAPNAVARLGGCCHFHVLVAGANDNGLVVQPGRMRIVVVHQGDFFNERIL